MAEVKGKLQEHESSVGGWISWARLERHLKKSGEIKPNERITHMVADEDGIRYYVEKDPNHIES